MDIDQLKMVTACVCRCHGVNIAVWRQLLKARVQRLQWRGNGVRDWSQICRSGRGVAAANQYSCVAGRLIISC